MQIQVFVANIFLESINHGYIRKVDHMFAAFFSYKQKDLFHKEHQNPVEMIFPIPRGRRDFHRNHWECHPGVCQRSECQEGHCHRHRRDVSGANSKSTRTSSGWQFFGGCGQAWIY